MDITKERKAKRLAANIPDKLSANAYNLAIGLTILYGFLVNAIIVFTCGEFFASINYLVFIVGYFVCCILGILITASDNPFLSFVGYNLVVVPIGAVLAVCLPSYFITDILSAIIVTGTVVAVMMIIATSFPSAFSGMGTTLFIALSVSILAEFVATLLGYSGALFDWAFVVIFSLYIGYDWHKAQLYAKTLDNALDSALDIYLDIINLFVRILDLISKKKR